MQIVVIAFDDKIELKFFCVEFILILSLEGAQKYFNTLSKERGDKFKSKVNR